MELILLEDIIGEAGVEKAGSEIIVVKQLAMQWIEQGVAIPKDMGHAREMARLPYYTPEMGLKRAENIAYYRTN